QTGKIVVQKIAVGGDGTFNFQTTGSGLPSSFPINTTANTFATFDNLAPGNYSIDEPTEPVFSPPPGFHGGWVFSSVVVTEDGPQNSGSSGTLADLKLEAGETIYVIYTNTLDV